MSVSARVLRKLLLEGFRKGFFKVSFGGKGFKLFFALGLGLRA